MNGLGMSRLSNYRHRCAGYITQVGDQLKRHTPGPLTVFNDAGSGFTVSDVLDQLHEDATRDHVAAADLTDVVTGIRTTNRRSDLRIVVLGYGNVTIDGQAAQGPSSSFVMSSNALRRSGAFALQGFGG